MTRAGNLGPRRFKIKKERISVEEPRIQPKHDRKLLIVLGGLLVLWLVLLQFVGPGGPSDFSVDDQSIPATYNWTLQNLDGDSVSFSDYEGKAVFLNIWATWCGPCIQEMPSIVRLAESPRLKGKNIEFVCVSVDDSIDAPRRFVAGKDWPMTVLHASTLPRMFLTEGIPATFILSPDGKVVSTTLGSQEWNSENVIAELEKLVAIPPKAAEPAETDQPEA